MSRPSFQNSVSPAEADQAEPTVPLTPKRGNPASFQSSVSPAEAGQIEPTFPLTPKRGKQPRKNNPSRRSAATRSSFQSCVSPAEAWQTEPTFPPRRSAANCPAKNNPTTLTFETPSDHFNLFTPASHFSSGSRGGYYQGSRSRSFFAFFSLGPPFLSSSLFPFFHFFSATTASYLLRDLAATADLPRHSALFSQQLLELTHKWWTEREDNAIDIIDVHPLAAAVFFHFKLHSARYPDPVPIQIPDPLQPARPLADLLTAIAALLARRQTTTLLLHIVSWGQSTTSLAPTRQQPGSKSSSSASPYGVSSSLSCLVTCSFHWFLPMRLLGCSGVADVYVLEQPFTMDSKPRQVAWFLSCAFWICVQVAGECLR